jgi:peptidyl-prolyl cis-trans isomerase D
MFDTIRNHKKYLMGFLLILIIPSFVLFGVQGFNESEQRGPVVATVDGQKIHQIEWDRAHQAESQRLRQSMPNLDPKLLDSEEARYATLERLVRERVLAAAVQKLNIHTSDQRLARDLQSNETIASLRRPDGTLDIEGYRQLLARQGLTPESFEVRMRADLSQRQVAQGIEKTGFAPQGLVKVALDAFFEQREVSIARFTPGEFVGQVQLSDADIETFYNSNPALFQSPEQANVQYLVLDAASLSKGITLAEADVRAYYDQNASRLSGNEERRASHILLSVAPGASAADKATVREKAVALLAQVKAAPQTFAEVAKASSQDPGSAVNGGDLDFFTRGAMVKGFEDAVFAMQTGDISDLVETEFGFHIIQLTDIKAPPLRSFESVRTEIEADLKKQQAQKLFADNAEAFSNFVYEQGEDLAPAAERFKLDLQTVQGLTRQPQPGASVWANERLLNAVFAADSIDKKRNTEAIETAPGQLVSARVVSYTPARTQPLAEVREVVSQRMLSQRSAELAREAGAKQLEAWKKGADASSRLSAAISVSRDKPQDLTGPLLNAALSADPKQLPAWVGVSLEDQGYAIVKVDKVLPRQQASDAQTVAQEADQYSQWWSSAESLAYYETLKERFKVQIKVPVPKPATAPAR